MYFDESQPEYVYKISKNKKICDKWKNEKSTYDNLQNFNIDEPHVKILKLSNYEITENRCCLELTRAINPIDHNLRYTIHPMFGMTENNTMHKSRGLFIGIKELIDKRIFDTNDTIKLYMKELGHVMAKLHYEVKNDGFDIELFLSKNGDDDVIVYIGDFDLSETITEYDKYFIDRMVWCFLAVPYFPTEGELFDVFSSAYISEATQYNMNHIAQTVIELLQN